MAKTLRDIVPLQEAEDMRKTNFNYIHSEKGEGDYSRVRSAKGHTMYQGGDRGGFNFVGKHPSGYSNTDLDFDIKPKQIHGLVASQNPHLSADDHKAIAKHIDNHLKNLEF